MNWLKQSTAATIKMGPFIDDTDGKTAETGLNISQADVRLSKNGGDMAQKNSATAATHDEIGYYDVPLSTTDTNTLGRLRVMVHESGALPVWADYLVVPANVYDAIVGGSDYLQVDAVQLEGADTSDTIATLATAAALATVDGIVDDILVDTGTTLPSAIAGLETSSAPTASQNAAAVWSTALGAHAAGTAGAKLNLVALASQLQAATAAGGVSTSIATPPGIVRLESWQATISNLADISGRSKLLVSIKAAETDSDNDSLVLWQEGVGLVRLNKAAAAQATDGTITVNDTNPGNISLSLKVGVTGSIPAGTHVIAAKVIKADGTVQGVGKGSITVTESTIKAIS